jgi:DNA-binding Lrp family transcriptional regulator
MAEIDEKDELLLNLIQDEVALVDRPFKVLGEKIGMSESETVSRIEKLKESKVLRQISTIFDTRSLGYKSSLVAARSAPGKADECAEILNLHPGISHNYARKHDFNLWFTIAVPEHASLQDHVDILQKESGAVSIRLLPTLRLFKIGMKIDMTGGKAKALGLDEDGPMYNDKMREAEKLPLTEKDIRYVLALQNDMPVRPDPFTPIAEQLGTTTEELFQWCKEFIKVGRMRRVAGIMNHRHAGFRANGMGVWVVPPERTDEIGALFAQQQEITHCYLRPTYPDWPFNVFTMVHSKKVSNCDDFLAGLAQKTGLKDYSVLYSYKEYKKIRLLYFTGEIEAWEKEKGLPCGPAK